MKNNLFGKFYVSVDKIIEIKIKGEVYE